MTKHDSKDEEILAGAPNNTWMAYSQDNDIYVTPLDNGNYLFKTSGATKSWVGNKLGFTRSQSDIVELVELRKKNAELENQNSINEHLTHENLELSGRIAELERENLILKAHYCLDSVSKNINSIMLSRLQEERDLEQQAKGLEILAESMLFRGHLENVMQISDVLEKADDLNNQAKQLKE